jgi:phosphoribosylformimino-5-aminoimidazole carboxamide ribonucleotide (ProFAR) isomerase
VAARVGVEPGVTEDVGAVVQQLAGQVAEALVAAGGVARDDHDVSAVDEIERGEPAAEGVQVGRAALG